MAGVVFNPNVFAVPAVAPMGQPAPVATMERRRRRRKCRR